MLINIHVLTTHPTGQQQGQRAGHAVQGIRHSPLRRTASQQRPQHASQRRWRAARQRPASCCSCTIRRAGAPEPPAPTAASHCSRTGTAAAAGRGRLVCGPLPCGGCAPTPCCSSQAGWQQAACTAGARFPPAAPHNVQWLLQHGCHQQHQVGPWWSLQFCCSTCMCTGQAGWQHTCRAGFPTLAGLPTLLGPSLCAAQGAVTHSGGSSWHSTACQRNQQASRGSALSSGGRRQASSQTCGAAEHCSGGQTACPGSRSTERLPHPHTFQAHCWCTRGICRSPASGHGNCGGSATACGPCCRCSCWHAIGQPRAGPAHGVPGSCWSHRRRQRRQPDAQHGPPAVAGAEPGAGFWRRHQAGGQPCAGRGRCAAAQADGGGTAHSGVGRPPVTGQPSPSALPLRSRQISRLRLQPERVLLCFRWPVGCVVSHCYSVCVVGILWVTLLSRLDK